jgi:hypothetical protein
LQNVFVKLIARFHDLSHFLHYHLIPYNPGLQHLVHTLNMNDTGLSALFCHLIFMVYWLCWIQVKFSTYNLGPQYLVHTLKMDGTYSYYLCICHLNLIVVSLNLDLYFSKTKYSHGRFKGKARPRSVSTRVKIFYALLKFIFSVFYHRFIDII